MNDLQSYRFLFLDRDGVINKKIPGSYVTDISLFEFLPRVLEALHFATHRFERIVIVTNQQGIGKGIMTLDELTELHTWMIKSIKNNGGHIDQIYSCPELAVYDPLCRKPNPGMGLQAKEDFPEIDFTQSVMIGDSESDILFGNSLGMMTIKVGRDKISTTPDRYVDSLKEAIGFFY